MIYYKHTAIVHLCTAYTLKTVGSNTPLESRKLSLFVVHDTQLTSGTFLSFLLEIESGIVSMFNKFFACEFSETDTSHLRNVSPRYVHGPNPNSGPDDKEVIRNN